MKNNLNIAIYNTKLKNILIGFNENEVEKIAFTNEKENNIRSNLSNLAFSEIKEYLEGKRKNFSFKYKVNSTVFQNLVYKEIQKIPYGKLKTYKQIAKNINREKAYRAVGQACNKNPLLILIPCHRVIASNNSLNGYVAGLDLKKHLIKIEKKANQ